MWNITGNAAAKGASKTLKTNAKPTGITRFKAERGQSVIELIGSFILFVIMISLTGGLCAFLYMEHALVSAAREGARAAAMNQDLTGSNPAAGEQAVKNRVIAFMQATTGQVLSNSMITVTGPDPAGTIGNREVDVQINYTFQNPINIDAFLTALGGSQSGLANVNMSASAEMRYEE